jgi:hypothetical protein
MNDERDLRDPALEALLRAHSTQSPPPTVDAAVLAAAHRAVDGEARARPARATQPWRWWMPLAAAAVIGVVVVGVLPLAPTLPDPAPPAVSDAPAGAAVAPSSGTQSIDAARPDAQDPRTARVALPPAGDRLSVRPDTAITRERAAMAAKMADAPPPAEPKAEREAASASAPPPAEKERRATATGAIGAIPRAAPQPHSARPTFPPQAAALPPPTQAPQAGWAHPPPQQRGAAASSQPPSAREALPSPDAMKSNRQEGAPARPLTADEWIARIRTLRSEDRLPDAMRALADFRTAFRDADARLPEDLRDWAKTVR